MAVPRSRALFACAIPTIIVILSYIWFRKKEPTNKRSSPHHSKEQQLGRTSVIDEPSTSGIKTQTPTVAAAAASVSRNHLDRPSTSGEANRLTAEATKPVEIENQPPSDDMAGAKNEIEEGGSSAVVEQTQNIYEVQTQNATFCPSSAAPLEVGVEVERCASVTERLTIAEVHASPAAIETELPPVAEVAAAVDNSGCAIDDQQQEVVRDTPACSDDVAIERQSDGTVCSYDGGDIGSSQVTLPDDSPLDDDAVVGEGEDSAIAVTADGEVAPSSRPVREESEQLTVQVADDEGEVVDAPPLTPVEEPELQNLNGSVVVVANGTNTSAYGSDSHSPAEDLLDSPTASTYSDLHSEGSSDSGKGGSDIHMPGNGEVLSGGVGTNFSFAPTQVYEFELAQSLCGRLIGHKGNFVNSIRSRTRAIIRVEDHPYNRHLQICAIMGTDEDIKAAIQMIRRRFPAKIYPNLSLSQVNSHIPVIDTLQLLDGVPCDVILSSLVNAGHFFVQQPTHPTHHSLSLQDTAMLDCYMNGMGAPKVPPPVELGIICAASTMGGWYRAQVVYLHPDSEDCEVKFVDYGGYAREPTSSLLQIRSDFMRLPFQASECYLANVVPIEESEGWSAEATAFFEEMAQGQILQTNVVGYSEEGIPHVHLFRIQGAMNTFINREMVNYGFARWVDQEA